MDKLIILVAICLIFSLANQRSYAYKNDDNEGSEKLETSSGTTTKPFLGCCFNLGNPFSFIKKKISGIFGGKKPTTSTPKSSTDKHSGQKIHHEITKHTTHLPTEKHITRESVFQKKDISPPSAVITDNTNQDEASNLNYTSRPRFSREYGKKSPRSKLRYYMPQTTFTFASRQRKYFTPSRSFVADTSTKSPSFDLPQHLYHATTKSDTSTDELHRNTSAVDMNDALSDLLYPSLFDSIETESSITTKASERKTTTLKFSKPSEHNHSNVYQYNNRKLLNYGNTNNYYVRRSYRNNSSFTVRRIVGPLNDSFVSSQIIALHNMLSRSNLYARRTYQYEDQRNKPRETRYTTGDLNKFLESLRLSRKPDAFKRHMENAKTSNTPIWVRFKKNNMFRTYATNAKVTRCPDFIENMEEDTSTMELYRHHKYYFGSAEANSKDSDDSIAELLKHYEKHTPALNRFEKSLPPSKEVEGSAIVMDSDEDVSLWCHFNGTFPDIRKMIIPRKYLEDKTKERKPFTATFYNRNVVITRYYPPTIEKILPPALRRKTTSAPTTPLAVSRTSLRDAPLVQAEPKLPILFPTQKVTTPKNIDPYGLLHKIMSYNKMRQTLYPNNSNAVLPGDKPHRLHPLNQLPPLLKLPFPLSQDHLVHTSDPRTQHFTILGDYRIHKDNQTLECVQNPAEFQRPLHAIAPPAGSGFYRLVQKYRVLENRTLQMISGGSKPKQSNAILRIISKRRKGSNTVAVEMRFYPLPSTVSKLRKGRIPHYLLR